MRKKNIVVLMGLALALMVLQALTLPVFGKELLPATIVSIDISKNTEGNHDIKTTITRGDGKVYIDGPRTYVASIPLRNAVGDAIASAIMKAKVNPISSNSVIAISYSVIRDAPNNITLWDAAENTINYITVD